MYNVSHGDQCQGEKEAGEHKKECGAASQALFS